jgi:hypothetical protein
MHRDGQFALHGHPQETIPHLDLQEGRREEKSELGRREGCPLALFLCVASCSPLFCFFPSFPPPFPFTLSSPASVYLSLSVMCRLCYCSCAPPLICSLLWSASHSYLVLPLMSPFFLLASSLANQFSSCTFFLFCVLHLLVLSLASRSFLTSLCGSLISPQVFQQFFDGVRTRHSDGMISRSRNRNQCKHPLKEGGIQFDGPRQGKADAFTVLENGRGRRGG